MTIEMLNAKIEEIKREGLSEELESMNTFDSYGHLLRHINLSDEQLKRRLKSEQIPHATTFVGDKKEILSMVHETLMENIDEIAYWLISTAGVWDEFLVLTGELNENVSGHGFAAHKHDWSTGAVQCSEFYIVVTKNENIRSGKTIRIPSVYPEWPLDV